MLVATGFHRPTTREEMLDKYGEELFLRSGLHFAVHLSGKDEDMVSLGTLPSGGKLLINKLAAQADLLVAEGFIEPTSLPVSPAGARVCSPESPADHRTGQPLLRFH